MKPSSVLADPCSKRWEELSGDDRRRACVDCGKDVLAVSELSLEEARAASKSGACLSFVELPGGLVRTREGWRLWRVAAVATTLVGCDDPPAPPPVAPPVALEDPAALAEMLNSIGYYVDDSPLPFPEDEPLGSPRAPAVEPVKR
jgi:hypothetical protein